MELKNNQGILFKNEKSKDSQPDFTGEVNVEGKVMRIALWKKVSAKGATYLSVTVDGKERKEAPKKEPETVGDYLNDTIPFD